MKDKNWREEARRLFFESGKNIKETAELTGVSRRSISGYLKTLPEYNGEKERRKAFNASARKDYKREWDRNNRSFSAGEINEHTIRREHDTAAMILSREKYR